MALSASFDWTRTAAQTIQAALENIGVLAAGETVDSDDQTVMLDRLNAIVKQWSHPADGSPGMKVWLRKVVYLFLAKGQREYTLGPSGDEAALSYSETTISANEASGQTVLSVTSTTGMTASDVIGIVQNDGTLHWTTIVSTGAGPTVTITAQLTAAADAGNRVFWYTTALSFRPTEILTAVLRDRNNVDTPLAVYQRSELGDFESMPTKTTQADATSIFYEPQRTSGKLTLDYAASDVNDILRMIALSPVDDLDSAGNDLAFPPEWHAAVEWELSKRGAPLFRKPWTPEMQENWLAATSIARAVNMPGYVGGHRSREGCELEDAL